MEGPYCCYCTFQLCDSVTLPFPLDYSRAAPRSLVFLASPSVQIPDFRDCPEILYLRHLLAAALITFLIGGVLAS